MTDDHPKLKITRRLLLAAGAGAALCVASPALADQAAEDFVAGVLKQSNAFADYDEARRFAEVEKLVDDYVDMRRVGRFVLGQYARRMSKEQEAQYRPLFRRYATRVYQNVMSDYSGQQLEVTNSIDRSPRDIIVNSRIKDARPGQPFANTVISWRVYRNRNGEMSVFDAGADGVWLAIEQRGQFTSIIANNGGGENGVDALIEELKAQLGG